MAYKSSIGSGNFECGNVTNSNNKISAINSIVNVNSIIADENLEIMRWLSPLDARGRHHDVRTSRVGGVGSWLMETTEFRRWRSGEGGANEALLFCYGGPGVGKTYLSSLVIDTLCNERGEEDITIAMFYCDFRDQQQQTTTNILGAILKQLVVRGEVLGHVRAEFQKAKMEVGGRSLALPEVVQLVKQAITNLPRVFVCIDALDECLPKNLPELLESLKDILQVSPTTRIFVTGRPQVEAGIKRVFATGVILPISPKMHDIKIYLERKLEMDTDPDEMSDSLREDILRIIPEKISGIFLLVSLNINAVLEATTISERRQKLMEMTKGDRLGDGYSATLERIQAQKGTRPKRGMDALMWVLNSERPLSTSELCHALGVKIGSIDLDGENIPTIRTLLTCSLGLITVDASSDTVRLVHLTLQEYLSSNPNLFQSPHAMIAEVCLTYLNFRCVREMSPALNSASATAPLVEYASWYWGNHIRREMTESVRRLALGLLIRFEQHVSSQLLLQRYYMGSVWRDLYFDIGDGGFTGLHGAAFLGIGEILAGLLAMKEWDMNARDGIGRTALAWAAVGGQEDIVKMLLQREDVNPNIADTLYGRTPLWLAAACGHSGIVKLLLERDDINPNTADTEYGQTPLRCAAEGGHEGIVKLLLERDDINPNNADTRSGQTPLWWAARRGHEGIVKLLLERDDINPDTADAEYGQTPLHRAAEQGHEGVVGLLLERDDINPDTADTEYGQTPLHRVAWQGRDGVAKLFLERHDINPNTADAKYGLTPLHRAAACGHEGVVKLFLERHDINPNTADAKYGRTPLWLAAACGHEGVVKLLLERHDINPDTADTGYSRTPLHRAAERGHEGVVKLLLERDDISTNTADTQFGQTPLNRAAERGHDGVVKLLLDRHDINPDTTDAKYGQTILWLAAACGHEGVVKLLLERNDINPNTSDANFFRTPLSWAAEGGNERIVELLLERDDVDPDIPDLNGKTPLEFAVFRQHTRVVELLSKSKPSLLVPTDSNKVLHHPSSKPADLPQNPTHPIPPTCLSVSEPLPLHTRPQLGMQILCFMIIFSLVFLFCLHILFSPLLPTRLSLLFHR